jgi:hypothetical protein
VTGAAKRKGDDAERQATDVLESVGLTARRRYGAGVTDDLGDLTIGAHVVVQVRNWDDFGRACIDSSVAAERQAVNAGVALGVGMARRRGGRFVITMTPATFAWLVHAAGLTDPDRQGMMRT